MRTCTSIRRSADQPKFLSLLGLLLLLTLTGCATCERHPVECAAVVGVLGTSLALTVNQPSHHHDANTVGPERPVCGRGGAC
jgi:hypothetical protein